MYPPLKETSPALYSALASEIHSLNRGDLSEQLGRVVIPPQILSGIPPKGQAGRPDAFSAMVYPWPRLTLEQRQKLELQPPESLKFCVLNGTVVLDLDDFGQICWLKLQDLPEEFQRFKSTGRASAP